MNVRILAFVLLIATAAGLLFYSRLTTPPFQVSGFIEADEIRLGSRLGGRVVEVPAREGEPVTAGAVLVKLDPFDLYQRRAEAAAQLEARRAEHEKLVEGFRQEEIAQAKARRDQLAAQLEMLETGPRKQEIAAAQARLRLANAELELAQQVHARKKLAFERNAISSTEMDEATTQLRVARETAQVRSEELNLLLEGTRQEEIARARAQLDEAEQNWLLFTRGYRKEEIAQAKAAVEAAEAALRAIEQQIDELTIVAPTDGTVEALELQPGDLVPAGGPALSLLDHSHLWVRAYVPENRLDLQLGQRVWVTVDSYPGEVFAAHLSFIARQAEFTPSNVQTPEERVKQVFRIKATLDEGLDRLRPGMAADVWFEEGAWQ